MGIAFPRLAQKKEHLLCRHAASECRVGAKAGSCATTVTVHLMLRTASATGGRKASEACHIQWSGISLTPKGLA